MMDQSQTHGQLFKRSLASSISIAMVWRLLLISLILTGTSYIYTKRAIEQEFEQNLHDVAISRSNEVGLFVHSAEISRSELQASFEKSFPNKNKVSSKDLQKWMKSVSTTGIDGFENFWVLLPDGRELIVWPQMPIHILSSQMSYEHGHGSKFHRASFIGNPKGHAVWTSTYYNQTLKENVISLMTPINHHGQTVAVLGHDLDLSDILKPLISVRAQSKEAREFLIFNTKGEVIYAPEKSQIKIDSQLLKAAFSSIIDNGEEGTVERIPNYDLQIASVYLPQMRWYLVSLSSISSMQKISLHISTLLLLFGLLALVIEIIWLYQVTRKHVKKPLMSLLNGIYRIANGDLTVSVHTTEENELGYLALAFNSMTENLREEKSHQIYYQNTLEQERQKAELANQSKSMFLANMSHEIRTPINGILGLGKVLSTTPMNTEQKDMLRMMEESASNLLVIINDILDLSKVEAGKLVVEDAPFDIKALLQSVQSTIAYEVVRKKINFTIHNGYDSNEYLVGDIVRLRQILLNLVGNAIKFTPEAGKVDVKISVLSSSSEQARLRFDVEDTGFGVPSETISKLFQPFTQADASTTRKFGGTGLGLTISKKLVEQFGGQIGVENIPGAGARFWFELPFKKGGEINFKAPISASGDIKKFRGLKVLVADDNTVNLIVAKKMLSLMECDITCVDDGEKALQALEKNHFDLLLLDCQMPVKDGYETAREIRSCKDPHTCHIPIIALTANAMSGDRNLCLAAGMEGFVTKPIDIKILIGEMERVFQLRKKQAA